MIQEKGLTGTAKDIKVFKESLDYCLKDYKNKHYWERIGIWRDEYILYKCSQCQKSKLQPIRFLNDSYVETLN